MDSTITRLLIATKQLLEGLAKWSREEVTDDAISAIYVKLGNDFNVACAAFAKENIGMSELLSVPTELRVCLESCLSDPPSQQTLERHLPKVRQIIIGLLTGLREKQRQYRDGVAAKRAKELRDRERRSGASEETTPVAPVPTASVSRSQSIQSTPITPNSANRSREELRKNEADPTFGRGLPLGPRPRPTGRTASLDDKVDPSSNPSLQRKSSSRSMRAKPVPATPTFANEMYSPPMGGPPVTVRPPSTDEPFTPTLEVSSNPEQLESLEALKQSDNLTRRASKRFSAYAITKMTGSAGSPSRNPLNEGVQGIRGPRGEASKSAGRELATAQAISASEDKRSGSGSGVRRTKSEFKPVRGPDGERLPMPPVPAVPNSLASPDLRYPTIEEEEPHSSPDLSPIPAAPSTSRTAPTESQHRPMSSTSSGTSYHTTLPGSDFLSPTIQQHKQPTVQQTLRQRDSVSSEDLEVEYPISIYLQIGRDVKKIRLESPPTIAALRVLFIERFQYNPGHADFPDIYLRDPQVGVQYELEDMSEVKNGSVINLNIDTVEQVKQHIDQGLAGLTQEIKELRSTVTAMRRASVSANAYSPVDLQTSPVPRPSERQFQDAAQKVIKSKRLVSASSSSSGKLVDADNPSRPSSRAPPPPEPSTPLSPTSSVGGSKARALLVVGSLKTQHEEVQNLRRELSVLRQVYVDFAGQTKAIIGNLRTQTSHVQNIAGTKVSTARAFIDAGKEKLEKETTDLIARGDTLQDAIDDMRADISLKKIRPRPAQVSEIALSLRNVSKARDDLASWIETVKPAWKTTWTDELSNIIAEQKFLENQEGFLGELEIDLQDSAETFHNIQQVVKQPPKPSRPVRDYSLSSSSGQNGDGGGLSTVLLEVQSVQPDPERRLEAIERAERARQLELASRTDPLTEELAGFVQGNKLKMSGGIEETERLRQAKSEATLRSMFAPTPE
ncbi:hypothetical protein RQP46_008386 [Phenoliferia psychrophenolica]